MDRAQLRRLALALLAAACGVLAAPAAAAPPTVAEMFEPNTVVVIDLTLSTSAEAELEADPDEYVEGTFSIAASDGTPAGVGESSAPVPVGIRLKGSASFRDLSGKAAFKIKFNEFGGSKYEGSLKRLTLNNMVQDPSMVHEVLTYAALDAAGIASPRAGHAYVRLNGIDYGVYLNLETLDDVALKRLFGDFDDPQHLYEGGPYFDLTAADLGKFEVDEGDEEDLADLEALIAAADAETPSFSERLAPVADLDQMRRFWAAERYLGHWDGYSGGSVNNYFLYSQPDGVFQMLPWGTDQALRLASYPFVGAGGTLFAQCLGEEACAAAYREDLEAVAETTAALDLASRAQALADLLRPWQQREIAQSGRAPFVEEAIAAEVEKTIDFLTRRPGILEKWLATGELPEEPEEAVKEEEAKPLPGPAPSGPPSAPPGVSTRLGLDRSQLGRGLLIARPAVNSAGAISLRAEVGPRGNRRRACVAAPKLVHAGERTLRCRLTARVRALLSRRALALHVTVAYRPADGGPPLRVTRVVRLPRHAPR